ncbi:MAG: transporter permease [Burkholderia sp.]|jgi:NitT/TauT family transport system permease protein|nr:transporter permease [Burkholderia sp.]
MKINGIEIPQSASLILWAVLWEIVGQLKLTILVPPLSATLLTLGELAQTESFWSAIAITGHAFFWGSAIAIVVGVPLGILMGRLPILDRLLLPWVNTFISAPLSALVPVIMALFGFGDTTIILTVVLFAIWIIILDARAGAHAISPSLVEMSRVYGASRFQAFRKIFIWSAMPEILTGIRMGMLRAVKGVIIGQLLVSIVGFGHLFEIYSSNFLMAHMWAILIVLFGLAFTLDIALAQIEKRVEHFAASRS